MYEGRDRKQRRATPIGPPRGLECKSRCKNSRARLFSPRAPHVKRAAWVLLREKGVTPRMFVSMAFLGTTCSPFDFSHGAASSREGCWNFVSEDKTVYYTKLLLERAEKTEKPSDEPPTDQEHRPGVRADQAHRARLIARSIICLGCLSLVKSAFSFLLSVLSNSSVFK